MKQGRYQVKEVAQISGVSVRTLHHYDQLGLLVPSGRNRAGYRLYSDGDLLRLQQILIGRELGLPLEEIRHFLDDPRFDRRKALLAQRTELAERVHQTEAMIRAVDAALSALGDIAKNDEEEEGEIMEMKKIFDGFDPAKYEDEAKQQWGHTDSYKESKKRTERYSAEDWKRFGDEQSALYVALAAALKAEKEPSDDDVMELAHRHRLLIDRWFYPCSAERHCGLADLYEGDSRFAATMDKFGEGLTAFLVQAIRANAARSPA
ncbi:MAG TPA: MerR family transcriptional regulator [Polyangiaceae bacterium]|nr:MerR family transcriptional regulator [Polyangiaceae bacterium]